MLLARRTRAAHADPEISLVGGVIEPAGRVQALAAAIEAAAANDTDRIVGQVRAVDATRGISAVPVLAPLPFVAGQVGLAPSPVTERRLRADRRGHGGFRQEHRMVRVDVLARGRSRPRKLSL